MRLPSPQFPSSLCDFVVHLRFAVPKGCTRVAEFVELMAMLLLPPCRRVQMLKFVLPRRQSFSTPRGSTTVPLLSFKAFALRLPLRGFFFFLFWFAFAVEGILRLSFPHPTFSPCSYLLFHRSVYVRPDSRLQTLAADVSDWNSESARLQLFSLYPNIESFQAELQTSGLPYHQQQEYAFACHIPLSLSH